MKNQDQILEEARAIDTASTQEETDHTHELPVVPGPLRTEPAASGFSLRNLIVDNPGPALLIGAGLLCIYVGCGDGPCASPHATTEIFNSLATTEIFD